MTLLKKIWQRIYLFFTVSRPVEKKLRKRRKREKHENVSFGQFTTIKSVLETLDQLFADIKKLEPKGKEFQTLARNYGPYICSLSQKDDVGDSVAANKLEAGFEAYGLPSFLINYRSRQWYKWKEDESVSEFFVARKQKALPFLKPKGQCACYECCFVGLLEDEKKPLEIYFNIVVHEGGEVEAYPYLAQIPRFGKHGRQVSSRMGLYYPDYTDNGKAGILERKNFLTELFCVNYNMVMTRESGINIIIKKGRARTTITVPPNRWKYFFKYREKVLTPSGRRKPIFHAVSSHHREYKNGKVVPIKTHYRGARDFRWGKYSVKIVLPGKHAPSQAEFGLPGELVGKEVDSAKWVDMGSSKIADKLNKTFEGE